MRFSKICFIDWFAYPLFNARSKIVFGGAQIQLYFLAKELARNKRFKIIFLTDNKKNNRQETFGAIQVNQLLLASLGNYWQFFIQLLGQLNMICADVYIQRAASAETGLIALVCRMLEKRFIFMVAHEQDINGDFVKRNGWRGKLFLLGLKLADKIICQTKKQQSYLAEQYRNKSVVVASGFPLKLQPGDRVRKEGVLWVARAEDWKQPEMFIRLAQKFPQEKFTMICPPAENNPNYFKIIETKAQKIPNLKFIPWVPFNRIDSYFRKAKIFVSTSFSEGFPNTFIQAWQNLVPVISYKVNPDKIIDKHRLGFCANGDEGQMEKLLKKVLKNNQLRRQLAVNSYNYVRQYHDLKKNIVNIIANIL